MAPPVLDTGEKEKEKEKEKERSTTDSMAHNCAVRAEGTVEKLAESALGKHALTRLSVFVCFIA